MKSVRNITLTLAALLLSTAPLSGFGISTVHAAGKSANLTIGTKGDQLFFDKDTLTAKAGQEVKLTFKNNAKKDSGLQHNWVLVKPGSEQKVIDAGIQAGPDKSYVPASDDVLAHTKLVDAGKSETITFKAPAEAGNYPYICLFPGHGMMMKGTLKVTK